MTPLSRTKTRAVQQTSAGKTPVAKGSATAGQPRTSRRKPVEEARLDESCFQPDALKFLRSLQRNNRREWFEPRKPEFESLLKQPMLNMIAQITAAMIDFAPQHMRPPQKCMMRIYRDTRFSSDKSPYKRNIAAWWAREGLEKTSGGGYYFHLSPKDVVIAAGVYMPERDQLFAIRSYLLEHHDEVRRLLNDRKMRREMDTFEGLPLTRAPKGFPKDHPALDLILGRQWGVSVTLPPEAALETGFVKEVIKRFRLAAPLIDALNTPLVTSLRRRNQSMFPMLGRVFTEAQSGSKRAKTEESR
jgi:uncharacterized protein (TIGR02453 family)